MLNFSDKKFTRLYAGLKNFVETFITRLLSLFRPSPYSLIQLSMCSVHSTEPIQREKASQLDLSAPMYGEYLRAHRNRVMICFLDLISSLEFFLAYISEYKKAYFNHVVIFCQTGLIWGNINAQLSWIEQRMISLQLLDIQALKGNLLEPWNSRKIQSFPNNNKTWIRFAREVNLS